MPDHCYFKDCKSGAVSPTQAARTRKAYGKVVCNTHEPDAIKEAEKAAEALMSPKGQALMWLARNDFKERTKGLWVLDGDTQIAVNMLKPSDAFPGSPVVGRLETDNTITEEGHAILRIDDIRSTITNILKGKDKGAGKAGTVKKEQPVPPAPDKDNTGPQENSTGKGNTENKTSMWRHHLNEQSMGPQPPKSSEYDITQTVPEEKHEGKYQGSVVEGLGKELRKVNEGKTVATEKPEAGTPKGEAKAVNELVPHTKTPDALLPATTYAPQGSVIKGFVPQLKEIGKIKIGRKGEKKTGSGYRLPEKFDHFEVVSLIRDANLNFVPDQIMQQLGNSPKELNVMLLYNDPTLNFTTRYNEYKGGKCVCQGDGRTAKVLIPDKDGSSIIDCDPDTCPQFIAKKCKPNGILSVILTDSPRLGGVYKFRTTSYNSIRSILSSLFFLRSLTGGVLAMIPLKLTVAPMTVQPKDSQTAQTIYVVNIEFAGTAQQLLEQTVNVSKYQSIMRAQISELEATARLALTMPESEEESKEVQAEYYPEQEVR